MRDFFLRPNWPIFERILYYSFWLLLFTSFFSFCYAHIHDDSFVFPLKTKLIPDFVKVRLFEFITPFGDFSPEINSLINFQKFTAPDFIMPIWAGRFLSISLFLTLTLLSSILIKTQKWWFYIGLSLVILFLVYFRLQEFGIISEYQDVSLIISILFVTAGLFALRNFFFEKSLTFHFLGSFIIWLTIWLAILIFGNGNELLFQTGNYSFTAAFAISIAFIILIANEPLHAFFVMISYSSNQFSKGRLLNFILISLLYLINVLFSYLHTIGMMDLDIIYTPFEFLLIFSIIAGFYGFTIRFPSEKYFGSKNAGIILYTGISAFIISFLCFAEFAGYDAITEVLEDATYYAQLGMGTVFFFYIVINFGDLLKNNSRAYKVVYKPNRFPLVPAMTGGLVIILALFMRGDMFPYYQIQGAIYSGMADNYLINGQRDVAEVFYEEASVFAYNNRRSNATLAYLYKNQDKRAQNAIGLKKALIKKPIPAHYIELSERFESSKSFFDAVFILQEGNSTFPKSQSISNNLGLLYTKSNILDSAFIYFNQTDLISKERNLSALLSKGSNFNPDDLPPVEDEDLSELSNRISIFNRAKKAYPSQQEIDILKDSIIEFSEYSYLYNSILNKILVNAPFPEEITSAFLKLKISESYLRDLYLLRALQRIKENDIYSAVLDFNSSENFSGMTSAYIADLSGTILWSRKLFKPAQEKLEKASRMNYRNSALKLFSFYVETGQKELAESIFDKAFPKDKLTTEERIEWNAIIGGNFSFSELEEKSEQLRYAAFKLHPEKWAKEELIKLPEYFANDQFKSRIAANIFDYLSEKSKPENAIEFYKYWNSKLEINTDLIDSYLRFLFNREMYDEYLIEYGNQNMSEKGNALFDAWYYKLKGEKTKYESSVNDAIKAIGYDPEVFILKLDKLREENTSNELIYNEILGFLTVFPENIKLKKAYIVQAIKTGLKGYADDELETLKNLISETEYNNFYNEDYLPAYDVYLEHEDW